MHSPSLGLRALVTRVATLQDLSHCDGSWLLGLAEDMGVGKRWLPGRHQLGEVSCLGGSLQDGVGSGRQCTLLPHTSERWDCNGLSCCVYQPCTSFPLASDLPQEGLLQSKLGKGLSVEVGGGLGQGREGCSPAVVPRLLGECGEGRHPKGIMKAAEPAAPSLSPLRLRGPWGCCWLPGSPGKALGCLALGLCGQSSVMPSLSSLASSAQPQCALSSRHFPCPFLLSSLQWCCPLDYPRGRAPSGDGCSSCQPPGALERLTRG